MEVDGDTAVLLRIWGNVCLHVGSSRYLPRGHVCGSAVIVVEFRSHKLLEGAVLDYCWIARTDPAHCHATRNAYTRPAHKRQVSFWEQSR